MKIRCFAFSLAFLLFHISLSQSSHALIFESKQKSVEIENVGDIPYQSLQLFIKLSPSTSPHPVTSIVDKLPAGKKVELTVDLSNLTLRHNSKPILYIFTKDELILTREIIVVNSAPEVFHLRQNYPNPFNSATMISYTIPQFLQSTKTILSIYDVSGKLIKELVNDLQSAGDYSVQWNGTNNENIPLSSGVYYYRLQAGDRQETLKLTLIK